MEAVSKSSVETLLEKPIDPINDIPSAIPMPPLDPASQALIDEELEQDAPPIQDLTPKQFRATIAQLQKEHTPIPGVAVTEFSVKPLNDPEDKSIRTFMFRPMGAENEDLPVIFYLHGGGWISGTVSEFDSLLRQLTLLTGCAIIFPEYTLAPEKTFPTQQEECFAVVKYIAATGTAMHLRTDKFAIAGDSAGGQLSPAVISLIRERKLASSIKIVFQVLFHPFVDAQHITFKHESLSEFEFFNGPLLTVPSINGFIDLYIPNPEDRNSHLASPILMTKEEAAHQPPTLIVVGSADPLRSEGAQFGRLLESSGVLCAVVEGKGQIHDTVFLEATRNGPTPQALIKLAAIQLKEALQEAPVVETGSVAVTNGKSVPKKKRKAEHHAEPKQTKRDTRARK